MSSLQTSRVTAKVVLHPLPPKNPTIIDGYCYHRPLPTEFQDILKKAVYVHTGFYKELCELFQSKYEAPYTASGFLKFMSNQLGIGYEVRGFDDPDEIPVKGFWQWHDDQNVIIAVKGSLPDEQKKLTVIHECFHVIQELDPSFKAMLLSYPIEIRRSLVEKIAEKSAIELAMPRNEYEQCKRKGFTDGQISSLYDVSISVVRYMR
jgi:hypothetical protein